MADDPDPREPLGRLVHEQRQAVEAERAAAEGRKTFNLGDWGDRTAMQRELDMRIGSAVAVQAVRDERERFRSVLAEHYLAGITCDRARKEDNPVCGCSLVFLGWHPNLGAAREAWIRHVMEEVKISSEGDGRDG